MGLSIDRGKIIKAYEECLCNNNHDFCSECYQDGPGFGIVCRNNVCRDALALLKEQETMMQCIKEKCCICPHCANCDVDENGLIKEKEAVKPRRIDGKRNHFIKCGNCNYDLVTGFQFCPHCGHEVKLDD